MPIRLARRRLLTKRVSGTRLLAAMHSAGNQRYITNLHRSKNQYSLGAKPLGRSRSMRRARSLCGSVVCEKSAICPIYVQRAATAACMSRAGPLPAAAVTGYL